MSKRIVVLGMGLIGARLVTELKKAGNNVTGTDRSLLNVTDPGSVKAFPWHDYDVVVNCTGSIDYENTPAAAAKNAAVNVLGPLRILEELKNGQVFYHCSTHAVLFPDQNTYTLSKALFEKAVASLPVVLLRLPGIFSDTRSSGLLYRIKTACRHKTPLELDFGVTMWHPMYLPRCVANMKALIDKDCRDPLVTIGYPVGIGTRRILEAAQEYYGEVPVRVKRHIPDDYVPDLRAQNKYIQSQLSDFADDMRAYFSCAFAP